MTVRTTRRTPDTLDTDLLEPAGRTAASSRRRPPAAVRRPALYLVMAAAGAGLVNVLSVAEPPAAAETQLESVSIAEKLGISADAPAAVTGDQAARPLQQLAASRSEREAGQSAAARA
ncbi:MAG: Transglycosylase protein, partial [Blastococcus sp.]|nr:Transglycosylase protein [Blastococcus sp.]